MIDKIIKEISSLPPLPRTVVEINEFKKNNSGELGDLIEIVKKDPLAVSTLLKIVNSAMFGFRNKVETVSKAVNLLGVNFTISITICATVQDVLETKLFVYDIDEDDFMYASNLSTMLVSIWLSSVNHELRDELILPALLQESGKFILATIIENENKTREFKELRKLGKTIAEAENEILGIRTSEVTAKIFKYWKLSESLINTIKHVDDLENCEPQYLEKSRILQVIKTICSVNDTFSNTSMEKGIKKAEEYGLDVDSLKKAIKKLQIRLLEDSE